MTVISKVRGTPPGLLLIPLLVANCPSTIEARRAHRLLVDAKQVILDVGVDTFTTPSDAGPTTNIPWPRR